MACLVPCGTPEKNEVAALQTLRAALPPEWALLSNLPRKVVGREIDACLVGPRGIVVVELKYYRGDLTARAMGEWDGIGGSDKHKNPIEQAGKSAQILKSYLVKRDPGLDRVLYIDGIVLLTHPNSSLRLESPQLASCVGLLHDAQRVVDLMLREISLRYKWVRPLNFEVLCRIFKAIGKQIPMELVDEWQPRAETPPTSPPEPPAAASPPPAMPNPARPLNSSAEPSWGSRPSSAPSFQTQDTPYSQSAHGRRNTQQGTTGVAPSPSPVFIGSGVVALLSVFFIWAIVGTINNLPKPNVRTAPYVSPASLPAENQEASRSPNPQPLQTPAPSAPNASESQTTTEAIKTTPSEEVDSNRETVESYHAPTSPPPTAVSIGSVSRYDATWNCLIIDLSQPNDVADGDVVKIDVPGEPLMATIDRVNGTSACATPRGVPPIDVAGRTVLLPGSG